MFAQSTAPTARDTLSFVRFHCFIRQKPFAVPWEGAELSMAERFLWALSLIPQAVGALGCFEVAVVGVTPHSHGRALEVCTDLLVAL